MRTRHYTVATLCGAMFLGASVAASAADMLDERGLKAVHADAEIDAETSAGRKFVAKFYSNGRMDGHIAGDATNQDTGTWKVVENKLCWKWFKWDEGQEICYRVEDLGDGEYRAVQDGAVGTTTYKVRPQG